MADDKSLKQLNEAMNAPPVPPDHELGKPDACAKKKLLAQAAIAAANRAQAVKPSRMRPATAGAFQDKDGDIHTGESHRGPGRPVLHKNVQDILDAIPATQRADPHQHGKCFEPRIVSDLLNKKIDPSGGTIDPRKVRAAENPSHGEPIEPCRSCKPLLKAFNIRWAGET